MARAQEGTRWTPHGNPIPQPGRDTKTSQVLEQSKSLGHTNNLRDVRKRDTTTSGRKNTRTSGTHPRAPHRPGPGNGPLGIGLCNSQLKCSECLGRKEETGPVPLTDDSFGN